MDNTSDDDGLTQFFDAEDDITEEEQGFVSDDCSCSKRWDFEFDVWISSPRAVGERRRRFMRWIEHGLGDFEGEGAEDDSYRNCAFMAADVGRAMESSGAVLRDSTFEDEFSSFSSRDFDNFDSSVNRNIRNVELSVESGAIVSDRRQPSEGDPLDVRLVTTKTKKPKKRWLNRLSPMACVMAGSRDTKDDGLRSKGNPTRARRVKVQRSRRRRSRELSALFTGQDIKAHEGSILAMKFSPDGQYLASAGEDKVVRVWKVLEEDRSVEDIPAVDPSCVCFSISHRGTDSGPLTLEEISKLNMSRGVRKARESACVVFPQKVFRILERPLHVLEGHKGEILDLSWSNNDCLLSSSTDRTVRLWRVGADECLKVFLHADYVTCVEFNPVNDDYFVSGSIDGKVRIWDVRSCQVVDWLETRDIISAVSYRPNGQGGVIGTIRGTCHLFNLSGNNFQLGAEICVSNKKKSPCKRITGFQFSPQDPTKLLVASVDSQVRLIHGTTVAQKYKGPTRTNAPNFISTSFTSDGEHILSACEDSNVYVWNYYNEPSSPSGPKKSNNSFEYFQSEDASIAIPWPGLKAQPADDRFPLGRDSLMGSRPKLSATWPEEKLPCRRVVVASSMGKSRYKFFKSCCEGSSGGHLWGLVIVTAGRDGWIRSFHSYGLPASGGPGPTNPS